MHRLAVHRLEVEPILLAAERHPQFADHERTAMRNGDAASDAGGAEVLPALQHLEEHLLVLLVQREQPDELFENVILGGARQIQLDGIFGKEFTQFHARPRKHTN